MAGPGTFLVAAVFEVMWSRTMVTGLRPDRRRSAARHVDVERLVQQLVEREVPLAEVLGGLRHRCRP